MRLVLGLVWFFLPIYIGINWATSVADTPGGAVVLSISAVCFLWGVGWVIFAILLLLGAAANKRNNQTYHLSYGSMSEADKEKTIQKMVARRTGTSAPEPPAAPSAPRAPRRQPTSGPINWSKD